MKRYVIGGVALLLLAATMLGASAFTTADVSRDANINVANDTNAVIGLTANTSMGGMTYDADGAIQIDAEGAAQGVNHNGTFEFGDNSSTVNSTNYAFSITNNDGVSHSMTFAYQNVVNLDGATAPVEFHVYQGGTHLGDVTPSTNVTTTAAAGETFYVVITVDTSAVSDTGNLSGNFVITAS